MAVGDEHEQLKPVADGEAPVDSWWDCYERGLGGLTGTARSVVREDSQYIVDHGVLGAGVPGDPRWPTSQSRSGLVMGAVQSGKTASMLGVAALSLDRGVDVVVVLAGTRVALWRQTYDRLYTQLIEPSENGGVPSPILVPANGLVQGLDEYGATPSTLYQLHSARVRRGVKENSPFILVVMKHAQHLYAASRILHDKVFSAFKRPVHLLVLDDEVDDGSILDAEVERNLDPATDPLKQIPRHVADLWSRRGQAGPTSTPGVFATYLAYTATPQANVLQSSQNPLAPKDFMAVLRTSAQTGDLNPRSTTFREPAGLDSYYTGGEIFYNTLGGVSALMVPRASNDRDDGEDGEEANETRLDQLGSAVRAYLVAAAVRLWRDPHSRRWLGLRDQRFDTAEAALAASPPPHTMLFHPAATIESHFTAAAELLGWANGIDADQARDLVDSGERSLSAGGLGSQLSDDEGQWRSWLDTYRASAEATRDSFDLAESSRVPEGDEWESIKQLLVTDVFPSVRFSIVNSAIDADDRPSFAPTRDQDSGQWRTAGDLLTIFVAGNVMARGLTLEGLTTTLFLRSSGDPAADTQTQMQRWFGYRGAYIELCRVFLHESQLDLFRHYHEADEALRQQLVQGMNESGGLPLGPTVLEGRAFRATAKIANVDKVPLCPGPSPFVDFVNDGQDADRNVDHLVHTFQADSHDVVAGVLRGRALSRKLTLLETASVLEGLSYDSYCPGPSDQLAQRWGDLGAQLRLGDESAIVTLPLFRPPSLAPGQQASPVAPRHCPYTIAAYLRFWDACLTRHVRGLFPTEDGSRPWSSVELSERVRHQPRFTVGIRFGSVAADEVGPGLDQFPFRVSPVRRTISSGVITSTWGTRGDVGSNPSYLGDQLFDYAPSRGPLGPADPSAPNWRSPGEDGLVLFHVIQAEDRPFPVVAVGVVIPLGGPDHFAARAHR